jgi:hypothetical protein
MSKVYLRHQEKVNGNPFLYFYPTLQVLKMMEKEKIWSERLP